MPESSRSDQSNQINSDLAGGEDDAGELAQEPPAGEAGDGGEGGRGEAHHHVRQRHVAHKHVGACQHSSTLEIKKAHQDTIMVFI